jgi:predicted aspartyl protease
VTAAQDGLLVSARINGSRPLRLLLDTGARGIVIGAHAARNLALETIVASRLGGFGDTGASESRVALARSVVFGDLAFEECLIEVSEHRLTSGADGVLGADIFGLFKIGVDAGAGNLQLTPFDDQTAAPADRASMNRAQPSIDAIGMRHLLLVKASVEGGKEGLFLVDTGAAFTVVSREHLPPTLPLGTPVELQGAQGLLTGAARLGPLAFRLGGITVADRAPLAMDLAPISQLEGIDIAGILGYSTLSKSPFTIDLRHGIVEFARASTH